ncbi:MAG: branched-chain amino acid ABC transporter permease [Rhodospirillaceae bacterium]|jgi:branched-chain amino acid transport system permease protein|nr:branched-chain amino acid ABC transporter permease [Rhodospirillaceae bacterium]
MVADVNMTSTGRRVIPENPALRLSIAGIRLPVWNKIWLIIALLIAVIMPFLVEDFDVFQMTQALIFAMAILGLNLLTGFNGQFSLGHSAFFGIGAYTTAIMMGNYEIAFYWTIIPAGVVCLIAGFLFGLPALRLEGLYLALATFALATAMPQILKYEHFEGFTGGVQGIDLDKPESPFQSLTDDQFLYFVVLVVTILLFIAAWNLVRGRTGRAMIAIRDNPIAAQTMGVNNSVYKSLTFGVSALYTGVAGSMSAIIIQFVAPDSFTFLLAVTFLVGLVVGGVASIPGAIFGGIFVLLIPNFSEWVADLTGRTDAKGLSWAVYGMFLIAAVYVMPAGAAGLVRKLTAKLAR